MFNLNNKNEFFRALSFIKPRAAGYITGLAGGSLVGAAASVMTAFVIKDLLEAAIAKSMSQLTAAVIMICLAVLMLCIFSPIFNYLFKSCIKRSMVDIRLKVFRHIEEMTISYYDKTHSGDTISRMTNDIQAMADAFSDQLFMIVHTLFTGMASAAFMFVFDWRIAGIMIILGILSAFANSWFGKPIRRISDHIQESMGILTQRLSDLIGGFGVAKIFHITGLIVQKYDEINEEVAGASMKRVKIGACQDSVNFLLGWLNFGGIMLIGALMAFFGATSFGKLAAILQLSNGVTAVFLQIGSFMAQLQSSLAGAARVFELLDEPAEAQKYEFETIESGNAMVELHNITFSYGEGNKALDSISLKVMKGQTAALVGPSGGGKSTVIKLLMGFYPPEAGGMIIDGKSADSYSLSELRSLISYVPQDAYLFDGTIEENIRYGRPEAGADEIQAAARAAFAEDFILEQTEGYNTKVGERGARLSGGQRQRIAIARAILKNAPVLLLDEATSALDSEAEESVQKALEVLMKNRTVIVVAHRLSTVENADVIYVIDEGRVIQQGTHPELAEGNGMYKRLYELQFQKPEVA